MLTSRPIKAYRTLLWKHYKQVGYGNYGPEKDYDFDPAVYNDDDADIKKEGWGDLNGMPQETAMERYIDLAKLILKYYA